MSKAKSVIHDPSTAILAADAFWNHSQDFLKKIGLDMETAHHNAVKDIGGLIASATTLTLSIELYLKALRMLTNTNVPKTHELWSLYKNLPSQRKEFVEADFDKVIQQGKQVTDVQSLRLAVWAGTQPPAESEPIPTGAVRVGPPSIKFVLLASNDAFTTWRYLHEGGKENEYVLYDYDFYHLGSIAKILRGHAVSFLS
jgi:hypothetical protein